MLFDENDATLLPVGSGKDRAGTVMRGKYVLVRLRDEGAAVFSEGLHGCPPAADRTERGRGWRKDASQFARRLGRTASSTNR